MQIWLSVFCRPGINYLFLSVTYHVALQLLLVNVECFLCRQNFLHRCFQHLSWQLKSRDINLARKLCLFVFLYISRRTNHFGQCLMAMHSNLSFLEPPSFLEIPCPRQPPPLPITGPFPGAPIYLQGPVVLLEYYANGT